MKVVIFKGGSTFARQKNEHKNGIAFTANTIVLQCAMMHGENALEEVPKFTPSQSHKYRELM